MKLPWHNLQDARPPHDPSHQPSQERLHLLSKAAAVEKNPALATKVELGCLSVAAICLCFVGYSVWFEQ